MFSHILNQPYGPLLGTDLKIQSNSSVTTSQRRKINDPIQYILMSISNFMTVVALLNSMIGGTILVLPLLALKTGTLLIAPVTIISGLISFYSCFLCLRHLGQQSDFDRAVLQHFGGRRVYQVIYDLIIAFSVFILLVLYFGLICNQWKGLFRQSKLIPVLNYLCLLPLVYILKRLNMGVMLLGYGLISIVLYIFFLMWSTSTAPTGDNTLPLIGQSYSSIAAALGQGFSIQSIFIPILKENGKRGNYTLLVGVTYLLGGMIYMFISYSGAISILNRSPTTNPQTIQDFFKGKDWEVMFIQIIYLVHLYSVFPQFLLVGKNRLFSAIGIQTHKIKTAQHAQNGREEASKEEISRDVTERVSVSYTSWKQMVCFMVVLTACLVIQLSGLNIITLIEINGAIVSFLFIYFIPIGVHLKCLYFTHRSSELKEEGDVGNQKEGDVSNKQEGDVGNQQSNQKECDCRHSCLVVQICEGVWLVLMTCFGVSIIVDSVCHLL